MKVLLFLLPLFGGCVCASSLPEIPAIPVVNNIAPTADIDNNAQPAAPPTPSNAAPPTPSNAAPPTPSNAAPPTPSNTYCVETHDTSPIKFYFWKRSPEGKESYEITYGNESQVKPIDAPNGAIEVIVFFHDIGGNGKEDWIIKSTNYFMGPEFTDTFSMAIISDNHAQFVPSKPEAVKNIDLIANHSAVFLKWVFNNIATPPNNISLTYIGHGMGALIASRTIQIMKKLYSDTRKPSILTVLDFEILSEEDLKQVPVCHQHPALNETDAENVIVIHTSTCGILPTIPACKSDTHSIIGKGDFYPNGGANQPGCSASDLPCKRKRAVELFYDELIRGFDYQYAMIAWPCSNFEGFQDGWCASCQSGCQLMSGVYPLRLSGRFYLYTNAQSKFGRGSNPRAP